MASKQEKLAAARKKLKEFQGKNKEIDTSKQKIVIKDIPDKLGKTTPFIESSCNQEFKNFKKHENFSYTNQEKSLKSNDQTMEESCKDQKEISELVQINHLPFFDENKQKCSIPNLNTNVVDKADGNFVKKDVKSEINTSSPLVFNSFIESSNEASKFHNVLNKTDLNITADEINVTEPRLENNNFSSQKLNTLREVENPNYSFVSQSENNIFREDINNIVQPFQEQLKNYVQTINVLVHQRNETQNYLAQLQSLLQEKSEEIKNLKQHRLNSDSTINILNKKLLEAEGLVNKLAFEKEEVLRKKNETVALVDSLKTKLESREEEYIELQKKFEERDKECEESLVNLQKAQSQLSLYQIQLQQFSTTNPSSLTTKVSELQNENLNLNQKIKELEFKVEKSIEENEQSSQKFHTYAQQCNSQLSTLNSQVESLKLENEALRKKNDILVNELCEVENFKKESSPEHNIETGNLHIKINSLIEENNNLRSCLNSKKEDIQRISDELSIKNVVLENLEKLVEEIKMENRKLALECKSPEANERLLAAMESDKVAAAKAVSQNQKLKNQILELEKAFLKMSEEKLKLTDELAHERHVNTELQKLINSAKNSNQCDEYSKNSFSKCHSQEPLVNDSNEIEELRNIIRQLQDDKVELKARLSTFERNEAMVDENTSKPNKNSPNQDHCEQTNFLLQQMEEKVRKTMNEIAVLDEEKEKLEHLVLQLQGETETIGEYITLYQKQRMLLRQRAQEKDKELQQLSKDKEELRAKLTTLDELVQHLIVERQSLGLSSESLQNPLSRNAERTAKKIRELITDIESTSLVKNYTVAFEHCSCCSGRLITL